MTDNHPRQIPLLKFELRFISRTKSVDYEFGPVNFVNLECQNQWTVLVIYVAFGFISLVCFMYSLHSGCHGRD